MFDRPTSTRRAPARDRRILRVAWLLSGLIHGTALVGLAVGQPLLGLLLGPPVIRPPQVIEVVARFDPRAPERSDPLLEASLQYSPSRQVSPATSPAVKLPTSIEQSGAGPEDSPALNSLSASSIVQRRVAQAIEKANGQSAEQNLDQLGELTGELNKVSTEESLDQLTTQLQGLLGLKARATQPSEKPVEGPFDMASAQIHDVRRQELKEGGFQYFAILLDAAGRQQETEIDEETGAQLHRTFELIKTNPLLEKVYRQVVMSLLDKIIPMGETAPVGRSGEKQESTPAPAPVPVSPPPPLAPSAPNAPLVPPSAPSDNTP